MASRAPAPHTCSLNQNHTRSEWNLSSESLVLVDILVFARPPCWWWTTRGFGRRFALPATLRATTANLRAHNSFATMARYEALETAATGDSPHVLVIRDNHAGVEASVCLSRGAELCSLRIVPAAVDGGEHGTKVEEGAEWVQLLDRANDFTKPTTEWSVRRRACWLLCRGWAPCMAVAHSTCASHPLGAGFSQRPRCRAAHSTCFQQLGARTLMTR